MEGRRPAWPTTAGTTRQPGPGRARWSVDIRLIIIFINIVFQLKGLKRRERRAQRRPGGGLTTSEEDNSDSAFPARTPENIKALDDLLEEEVPVPGDSGRGSIYPGHPGWAFLGKIFPS